MNIYITLDYELFFGHESGSVDKCIIEPTKALLQILEPYGIKATFFVDSGYLIALERQKDKFPSLQKDYEKVTDQIKYLASNGHGIELHVHPHWEDSYYMGNKWVFNTERYRLADFNKNEVLDIVTRYTDILLRTSKKKPVAYRAGGWSAQPFEHIKSALEENEIFVDSTAFPNGHYVSPNQEFDFRGIPQYKTEYYFDTDLTVEKPNGRFKEIPISSTLVSPLFFWRLAKAKLSGKKEHKAFGNGLAIPMNKKEMIRLMLLPSHSVVSVDGYKAKLLKRAFKNYDKKTNRNGNFVLIGHPKAFTPYSLSKLEEFIECSFKNHKYVTF
ncbi:MAG: polysaccharide deacetylase family protein [Allomuricauda sp.]